MTHPDIWMLWATIVLTVINTLAILVLWIDRDCL